jgi:hypothetical protein
MTRLIAQRVLLPMLLGFLLGALVNEISFLFLKTDAGRGPERIELVIPAGTAARVAQGQSSPVLPASLVFVIGDTLVIRNQDTVVHQLGPLYIPAGTSASMTLNQAENLALRCSFQVTQYEGLDVQEPVTLLTRFAGLLVSGLPLGFLFMLYGLIWKRKPKAPAAA